MDEVRFALVRAIRAGAAFELNRRVLDPEAGNSFVRSRMRVPRPAASRTAFVMVVLNGRGAFRSRSGNPGRRSIRIESSCPRSRSRQLIRQDAHARAATGGEQDRFRDGRAQ